MPSWRRNLELSLTQSVLAGAAGIHTALIRLPYSSEPDALTVPELAAARDVAAHGYLLVFSDRDSEDWRRPGVRQIVANAMPAGGRGAIVMLHDGGGNRSETVAALEILIRRLKAEHYRFVTVSDVAGVPRSTVMAPVSTGQHFQGLALIWTMRLAFWFTAVVSILPIPVLALLLLRSGVIVALARRHVRRVRSQPEPDALIPRPGVAIVVPAYNEEVGIEAAVTSMARSDYPDLEIVVVDEGSTDRTAELVESLELPNVIVIRQANRGKADALNAGIARVGAPIVVTVDADTQFEPTTVSRLVEALQDPEVGAVSGNTKVGNRHGLIGRWQHIEYVMGFNLDRRAYDELDCMPTVPGAVGAFRREALQDVGGFSDDTLAEDTDVTMAINRAGWRVVYEERAVAWTEAPSKWAALWQQRYRWAYGRRSAGRPDLLGPRGVGGVAPSGGAS